MDEQTREQLTALYQEKEQYREEWLAALDREAALLRHIEAQEKQIKALEPYPQLYESIRNAFWWRVTGPLRRLTEALRPKPAAAAPAAPEPIPAAPEAEPEPTFEPVGAEYRSALTEEPLVSILIPNREHTEDLSACIESIFARSRYRNFEILIAENGSFTNTVFRYYENVQRQWDNVRVLRWDGPFNYSAINNFAAREARGEYLLLLNNDTEVLSPEWLEEMLCLARREEIGAVGALLLYGDGSIQHAGMSVTAAHPNRHLFRGERPEGEVVAGPRYVDAVTGACLLLRRSLWEELGGLDETFEVAFNDVDLCMRLRQKGYRIAYTPFARLYHHEAKSRRAEDSPEKLRRFQSETRRFRIRWLD